MAQRYGGKYSAQPPQQDNSPANAFRGQSAARVPVAARLMYILPLPLLLAAIFEIFSRDIAGIVVELGAYVILMIGAVLLNNGIKAERAYEARKVARPPAFPRKLFAAFCAGAGVALAATSTGLSLGMIEAVVMGTLAAGAHVMAFGLDPMKKKGMTGISEFENERVAAAVDRAEDIVKGLLDAARRIGDRALEARVERLAAAARDVFRTVEDDPRDLPRARKFMTVYLSGARDATAKFADIYSRNRDQDAKVKYTSLLDDLEASFTSHRVELLKDDRIDLDVEIEVLQDRLQREGISAR